MHCFYIRCLFWQFIQWYTIFSWQDWRSESIFIPNCSSQLNAGGTWRGAGCEEVSIWIHGSGDSWSMSETFFPWSLLSQFSFCFPSTLGFTSWLPKTCTYKKFAKSTWTSVKKYATTFNNTRMSKSRCSNTCPHCRPTTVLCKPFQHAYLLYLQVMIDLFVSAT